MEQDQKVKDQKQEDKWENVKEQYQLEEALVCVVVGEDLEDFQDNQQVNKMPRPCIRRRVRGRPNTQYFKPAGVRIIDLEESILTVDEFEAVRLKDLEGLEQEECAKKMDISQPTFHRLVLSARKKIADAIVNGKAIKIEGGNFIVARRFRRGRR